MNSQKFNFGSFFCLVEAYGYAEISSRAAGVTPTGHCMNLKGWVMFPVFNSSNDL